MFFSNKIYPQADGLNIVYRSTYCHPLYLVDESLYSLTYIDVSSNACALYIMPIVLREDVLYLVGSMPHQFQGYGVPAFHTDGK